MGRVEAISQTARDDLKKKERLTGRGRSFSFLSGRVDGQANDEVSTRLTALCILDLLQAFLASDSGQLA